MYHHFILKTSSVASVWHLKEKIQAEMEGLPRVLFCEIPDPLPNIVPEILSSSHMQYL